MRVQPAVATIAAASLAAVLVLACSALLPGSRRIGRTELWENYHEGDYYNRQVRQAKADGRRRQVAADALGGGLDGTSAASSSFYGYADSQTPIYGNAARREVTEDDRHNPILGNEGHALLDFWDGIRAKDKGTRLSGQYIRRGGGIGTFPGGQSTGGQSEMEEEKEWNHKYVPPLTSNQQIMAKEMRSQVWAAMAPNGAGEKGGCKDSETSSEAADCVREALKLDPSSPVDKQALNMAAHEWRALRRPGSEEIGPNDKDPSLEDIIEYNEWKHSKEEDLGPARARMEGMQSKLDKIVNVRNFHTEHLTQDSNDAWLGHTSNICCKDYLDTECSSPCPF